MSLPPLLVVSMLSVMLLNPTPPLLQQGDDLQQVLQRAPQPVQPPHDEGVAGPKEGERLVQPRPLRPGAADRVGEQAPAAGLLERVALQVERLLLGRDPGVPHEHGLIVPQPDSERKYRHALLLIQLGVSRTPNRHAKNGRFWDECAATDLPCWDELSSR